MVQEAKVPSSSLIGIWAGYEEEEEEIYGKTCIKRKRVWWAGCGKVQRAPHTHSE